MNSGAAFGILPGQTAFLIIMSLFGLGAIVLYYVYPPMDHGLIRIALGMQLGGAIGNLLDRLRFGEVTDWIDVGEFPTFNVADACISTSIVIVIGFFLLQEFERKARQRANARAHLPPTPRSGIFSVQRCRPRRLSSSQTRVGSGLTCSSLVGCRADTIAGPEADRRRAVVVNGSAERASYRLAAGQRVSVTVPEARESSAQPENIALDIIYEDADIIAINKPAGMTVHPAPGHPSSTLVNAILAHCADLSGIGGVLRPGIVHRLDRDTSGVILVAKNDEAHNALAKQLKERTVEKTYLALVEGTPKPAEGTIDAPIARDPRNRQRMAVIEGGRESVTAYKVVERFSGYSLVEARPKTGRTHQIRVHLAAIGHPIVGDRVYGKASKLVARQFLHAARSRSRIRVPASRWICKPPA